MRFHSTACLLARNSFRLALMAGLSASALVAVPAAAQSAQAVTRSFDIPAQPLAQALQAYMRQSGIQLSYPADLAEGRSSAAVKGSISSGDALSRLLVGTGLTFRFVSPSAVTLELAPRGADGTVQLGAVRVAGVTEGASGGYSASLTSDPLATEGTRSYAPVGASIMKGGKSLLDIPCHQNRHLCPPAPAR